MKKHKKRTAGPAGTVPLRKAFATAIQNKGIWNTVGARPQTVLNRRVQARKGQFPGEARMRTWLKKAGWVLVTEEQWKPIGPGTKASGTHRRRIPETPARRKSTRTKGL